MKITFTIVSIILLLNGCFSKERILFQDEDAKEEQKTLNVKTNAEYDYKIVTQDRVSIEVYKHPDLSTSTENKSNEKLGLKVSKDGTIRLPLINDVKIEGLTEEETALLIEEKLSKYIRSPHVKVEILNKRAYVLGEVKNPGVVAFNTDYMNIINLISLQGGFTEYADKENIKIIKGDLKNPKVSSLDLTDMNDIKVSNLIIEPNDIIYIQPNDTKQTNLKINEYTPLLGLIGSLLSTFTNIKYLSE